MKLLKNNIYLILLIALSIIAILPLLHPGFFNVHDNTQVQRVYEMRVAMLDAVFPVRWVPDLGYGYGYPIFNFYGPLPYYIGAFITFLGADALLATKIMILIGVIGAAFSMFVLARQFWGKWGGALSAVLYLYAPYHGLNIYVRGDIGEVYAYFFIPLIFYGLWKYYKTQKYIYLAAGALSFAGVIISHNLSAMMITPFVIAVAMLLFALKRNWQIFLSPIIGILISSFFILPAMLEMGYTNVVSTIGGKADFRDHFVCLVQLWDSPWMYGGSIPGCVDGLSFRLGKLHIIFAGLAFLSAFLFFRKEKEKVIAIILSTLGLLLSLFLLLNQSKFLWEVVPYMNFFQYPWRFLLVASFFSSFAGGAPLYFLSKFEKRNKWLISILYLIILISPIVLYSKLFAPQEYLARSSQNYTNSFSLNFTTSKISDEYMPKNFKKPEDPSQIIKEKITGDDIRILNIKSDTKGFLAEIQANKETNVTVHIPYFPAWEYRLNGQKVETKISETGVDIAIPRGINRIDARFKQTNVEKFANLLSISGIAALLTVIIYGKQKPLARREKLT